MLMSLWLFTYKRREDRNMEFEIFLSAHPFINWILGLFELLSPTMIAIATIVISHKWEEKRYRLEKKMELRVMHLEKCMLWMSELLTKGLEVSRQADNCLNRRNPEERMRLYNVFIAGSNEMVGLFISKKNLYEKINNSLSIDLEIEGLRVQLEIFMSGLRKMCDKYIRLPDTNQALDINNKLMKDFKAEIERRNEMISNEIMKLIK